MKRLRNILNLTLWTILGIYLSISLILHIPAIQQLTGKCVADALCQKFGTKVSVGKINLGFLNRLIIDDFNMLDKEDKPMLHSSRLSVSIDLFELAEGKISISSAQIFGLRANAYKKNEQAQANFQFVIDSLSTSDNTEKQSLNLKINSFIIRHGEICYNQLDKPQTNGKITPYHINVSDISSHISVRQITDNSINVEIKKLSFNDCSGLKLKDLSFSLSANKDRASLRNMRLAFSESTFRSDSITVSYKLKGNSIDFNSLCFTGSIDANEISPKDFSFLLPKLKDIDEKFMMSLNTSCMNGNINVAKLSIATKDNGVRLYANGHLSPFGKTKTWGISLKELFIDNKKVSEIGGMLKKLNVNIPQPLDKIERLVVNGTARGNNNNTFAKLNIQTNLGNVSLQAEQHGNAAKAEIATEAFQIGKLLGNTQLNKLNACVKANGILKNGNISSLSVDGNIKGIDYNGYSYKNILLNGKYWGDNATAEISINDPNCTFKASGSAKNIRKSMETRLYATIDKLNPKRINLSAKWGDAIFSTNINAHAFGSTAANIMGELSLDNFQMHSAEKNFTLNSLTLNVKPNELKMSSDFGNIELTGKYNFASIDESINAIIRRRLPTLPGKSYSKNITPSNNFRVSAEISDTEWLETLLGIPFHANLPIKVEANVNDEGKQIFADVNIPDFSYDNDKYHAAKIKLSTINDTVFANVNVKKLLEGGNDILLNVKADAANNKLNSSIYVDYNTPTRIKGTLNTQTQFYKDFDGLNTMHVNIEPSQFSVKDTIWNLRSSNIIYNESKIRVNHFAVEHNGQHIKIDGEATKSPDDSICVDLRDVNVKYILDLVNFHSVEFSGQASGKAFLKSVLSAPDAYANLTVDNFRFQEGRMGKLHANVNFDNVEKQINIDAHADEENGAQTLIKGYVSPAKNYIDLGITARNTNIEFLQSFCSSFMNDINGHANGFAQVYGDLSEVNLRGKLVADGQLKISTLNTVYNLKNDTILMVPNEIIFSGDTVTDRNGNIAIVKGALHHKNLTRLTYDIDITADHFLCYDFHDYGGNTFYGTIYGSGNCAIKGRPHEIDFNIDMTPHSNSFIEYNAASPDAITDQNFIKWNKHCNSDSATVANNAMNDAEEDLNDASDMNINFNVNVTPDFTLRVLMDKATGDKISLNGYGALKASYFNKGNFDMFGTYQIDQGSYNLTIQNIIKKDFKFQQGSSIVFGGNPFNALLNLKAVYPVNGVSLADLKIGNSFSSNNVKVDCIMNIGGTPESIRVDFDFDMPTVNSEAKQMVRSLINSEEEMNQQVVYLLAIGRFITNDKNNSTQEDAQQSQTSLAMQSLLSGTISQQVNNILGSVVNSSNWNFGTNISTGTEGFNNAEYEGLLSGSLFSNRLLINGQFGYRDNPNTTTSFIGDFDVKYLLTPNGNMAIKVYNQTNDRYFTKSSLNTQGFGLILKRDFNSWRDLWRVKKKKKTSQSKP